MTLAIAGNASGGYNINKSLRFRSSASASLTRTFSGGAGNTTTFTLSLWVKRGALVSGTQYRLFDAGGATNTYLSFSSSTPDTLEMNLRGTGGTNYAFNTSAVFRDPAAWYHIVWAVDTTQATSTNRVKLYVNNVLQTYQISNYPPQNQVQLDTGTRAIGASNGGGVPFDGYLAEINWIDGQQLTPSSFGTTNTITGVWQPAKYTGSYGTTGFYLPFTNTTSTTTLGYDFSGNGNNWTTNNISLTAGVNYDSMNDVPTLTSPTQANYPTFNAIRPGSYGGTLTLSNGNLKAATIQANSDNDISCTMEMPGTGKWYWEVTITGGAAAPAGGTGYNLNITGTNLSGGVGWASKTGSPFSTTFTTNDVLGIAVDYTTLTWYGYKNGVLAGSQAITTSAVLPDFYYYGNDGTGASAVINFGQQPWVYGPPSGFLALNSYNLPDSTIKAGNKYMDATAYSGNGSTQTITNAAGFKPDLVWLKCRSAAGNHELANSIVGVQKYLRSNTLDSEISDVNSLQSFNSNGFSVGLDGDINGSGKTFVGWQWQAGQGTTTTNTSGSITSTVTVNPTTGFSIVTFNGNGTSGATVGHGLGVAPQFIALKIRNATYSWAIYHVSTGNTSYLQFNSTIAATTDSAYWNNTSPTSSVFTLGNKLDTNASFGNYIAYCWAPIAGFSKFGSYTGTGSATYGPFVYCGFRPKYVMTKKINAAESWVVTDSTRSPYNVTSAALYPNSTTGDDTVPQLDFLSNGFKIRDGHTVNNNSGDTYLYVAFAENPFKNALAR